MAEVDLRSIGDSFVLHYGGQLNQVDAYTFGNSLMEIAEALRVINSRVRPEFSVEISIDALGGGSFRARLKSTSKSIFSFVKEKKGDIVVGLLVALLYDKLLASHEDVQIVVNDDSYVIQRGTDRIVLPKEVYDRKPSVANDPEVSEHVSRFFGILDEDQSITEFGITERLDDPAPLVKFPRDDFASLAEPPVVSFDDEGVRHEDIDARLQIIRAIFEKSRRKWQFAWNGIKISAPIDDDEFLGRLMRREVTLGSGDILSVTMRLRQVRDPSGVFINETYSVLKVHGHEPGPSQGRLFE